MYWPLKAFTNDIGARSRLLCFHAFGRRGETTVTAVDEVNVFAVVKIEHQAGHQC